MFGLEKAERGFDSVLQIPEGQSYDKICPWLPLRVELHQMDTNQERRLLMVKMV